VPAPEGARYPLGPGGRFRAHLTSAPGVPYWLAGPRAPGAPQAPRPVAAVPPSTPLKEDRRVRAGASVRAPVGVGRPRRGLPRPGLLRAHYRLADHRRVHLL